MCHLCLMKKHENIVYEYSEMWYKIKELIE